jgi:type II secretory pathway component PulF
MEELNLKIGELEKKIDSLQLSINKLNKIFFWTLMVTIATTVVLVILPLIALVFILPQFLSIYTNLPQI